MYAQQLFSALFTGVVNTIACVCRRGVSGVFPAGLRLALVQCEGSVLVGEVSPHFLQEVDVYVLCVCVRTRAHTARGVLGFEPRCRDETPGEPGRSPDVL